MRGCRDGKISLEEGGAARRSLLLEMEVMFGDGREVVFGRNKQGQ